MQRISVPVDTYKLSTRVNFVTEEISERHDPGFLELSPGLAPPTTDTDRPPPANLTRFDFTITVEDIPLPPQPAPDGDLLSPPLRLRFESMARDLEEEFNATVRELASTHLGADGWMVEDLRISSGSLTIAFALFCGYTLTRDYKKLREGTLLMQSILTRYALPFTRGVVGRLYRLDETVTGLDRAKQLPTTSSEPAQFIPAAEVSAQERRHAAGSPASDAAARQSSPVRRKGRPPASAESRVWGGEEAAPHDSAPAQERRHAAGSPASDAAARQSSPVRRKGRPPASKELSPG
jgi:hypothetical protein